MRWALLLGAFCGLSGALLAQTAFPHKVMRGIGSGTMVFDEGRNRIVVALPDGELLEHDGATWALRQGLAPANPRVSYDEVRQRLYFSYLDVREYDGHAARSLGSSSILQVMVADSHRGKLVGLRAAPNVSPPVLELVEFDGSAWSVRATFPPSRGGFAGTFDRARHVTVLQTFVPGTPTGFETWEWDGTSLTGPTSDSVVRTFMAFDSTSGRVVGTSVSPGWQGLDAWDGTAWTPVPNSQPPHGLNGLAADARNGRLLAFGTTAVGKLYLLQWQNSQWTQAVAGPMPTAIGALAHDALRDRVVSLATDNTQAEPRIHAEFDGFAWHAMPIPATAPPTFRGAAYAYDPLRGETVLFGGLTPQSTRLGTTYGYGINGWQQRATTGPSPRFHAGMTLDASRGVIVLVGGFDDSGAVSDHWEWNGVAWSQVSAGAALAPGYCSLGFDPLRQRLVALDANHETWEYVAGAWTMVAPSGAVSRYSLNASTPLTWLPSRQALALSVYANGLPTTGLWDGVAWTTQSLPIGNQVLDATRDAAYIVSADTTWLLTDDQGTAEDYGTSCGGSTTTTSLTAFRRPRYGDAQFHLDLRADAAVRPALIGFGLGQASTPLGNGCEFLLQNPFATRVWFTDANGYWPSALPLPNATALRGFVLHAQGAVLDPASPGSLAMSQGLRLTIGD